MELPGKYSSLLKNKYQGLQVFQKKLFYDELQKYIEIASARFDF
jgi:hypothetical protein